MRPRIIPVDDQSRVGEVRRLAVWAAESEGFDPKRTEEVAIVATETATNLWKHAHGGQIFLSCLSGISQPGVEIISVDRGPGMASVQACIADGYSTSGTPGTGLGAITRLADEFDAYSQVGKGTVLVARKFASARPGPGTWTFASLAVPYPGEEVCGDNWSVRGDGTKVALVVADGLGHGVLAAEASRTAVEVFRKGEMEPPASMLENIHLALRSSRGAAVAVAVLECASGRIGYAGVGNIVGVLVGGARSQFMVSHNGTAGLALRRLQQFDYTVPPDGLIVMHSDGLISNWTLDLYPGLRFRHPSVIAGVLWRDASRGRDDSCVVVGKRMAA